MVEPLFLMNAEKKGKEKERKGKERKSTDNCAHLQSSLSLLNVLVN